MSNEFVQAIVARRKRFPVKNQFNYGIRLASDYVQTLLDCIGVDQCYRFAAKGSTSFNDLMLKAASTLVYGNEDMTLEEKRAKDEYGKLPSGIELPKNTLMAFKHTLTSSRMDRDGDTLHSEGASVDPKMLLLWQHVHTLPIGKHLGVAEQNADRLKSYSCIVDINELCHDAAVMLDNGMGRFSHGFRALEFVETKAGKDGAGGFDVKSFEIMEESLVSVPSNVDAEQEEVILGLVEGGKLKSPIMREVGQGIRSHRNVRVPGVGIEYREKRGDVSREIKCGTFADLKAAADAGLIGGEKHENEPGGGGEAAGGAGAGTGEGEKALPGASEEADAAAGGQDEGGAGDEEVKCPECGWKGPMPDDGKCPECGADLSGGEGKVIEEFSTADFYPPGEKPFPNEHSARITKPEGYAKIRRQNNKFGEGVHAIFGVTEDGKVEIQAIRFDSGKFTPEEAKKWLEEHDYKTGGFEPAKEKSVKGIMASSPSCPSSLSQSWEESQNILRDSAKRYLVSMTVSVGDNEYVWLLGTFPDHVIVIVERSGGVRECWRIDWESKDGDPVFVGEPKRVEVQTTTEIVERSVRERGQKAGRVLSRANENKIRDAKDDVDEAAKQEVPRPCKALLTSASRGLGDVLSAMGEQGQTGYNGIKDAMAVVIGGVDRNERRRLIKVLTAIDEAEGRDRMARQYREMVEMKRAAGGRGGSR